MKCLLRLSFLALTACSSREASDDGDFDTVRTESAGGDINTDARRLGNPQDLSSEPTRLDFGRVAIGQSKTMNVRLVNKGADDRTRPSLGLLGDTGPWVIDEKGCETIPGGGQCDIAITYRPERKGPHTAHLATWGEVTEIDTEITGDAR